MNIYTRSFDNNYQPISEIIMVNDDAHMTRHQPDVCFDDSSNYFVVWADERERESRSDPRELNIYGQVYELNGIAIRKNFRVNEPVNLEDREPDIDFFNGAFSVSWKSWNEAIRIDETYVNHWQYNPKISGTMISSIFNSGPGGSDYLYLSWDEYLAQNTSIYFKIRSANSLVGIDNEDWYGISDTSNYYTNSSGEIINPIHNGDRFIQYKAFFHSSTPAVTPVLNSVSISYTTLDTIPPSVPINLSAQAGHSSVILTWEANSEVDLSNYKIYRTTQSGSYESPWIKEVSSNLTSFIDSSVVSGGTYYYKISAVDSSYNESELSDEIISKPFGIQIFVSPTGSDGGDGSIMDPYQKISDAIEISLYGDEVMVLPGIYSESIVMKKGVSLIGSGAEHTQINGAGNIYTIKTASNTIITGFTIINYTSGYTHAIWCLGSSISITDNILRSSSCTMNIQGSNITVAKNYIYSNGLGILLYNSPTSNIKNNIFDTESGITAQRDSETSIINNTFLFTYQGINVSWRSKVTSLNNIFDGKGSSYSVGIVSGDEGNASVSYSNFWDMEKVFEKLYSGVIQQGNGIISEDPKFKSTSKKDYRLSEDSPCIDAGHSYGMYNDVDGSRNDLGAFGGPTPIDPNLTLRLARSLFIKPMSGFPGDTVFTYIALDNSAGIAKAEFEISYDKALLSVLDVQLTETTSDFALQKTLNNSGKIEISIQQASEIESSEENIVKMIFTVNTNAKSGDACSIAFESNRLFNGDGDDYQLRSVSNGTFRVNLGSSDGNYIFVDHLNSGLEDGSCKLPYRTISDGIAHATPGDTVIVSAGEYHYDNLVIDKEIYLRGTGASVTKIKPLNDFEYRIDIKDIPKGEISGFSFEGSEISGQPFDLISCVNSSLKISKNHFKLNDGMAILNCSSNSNVLIENNAFIQGGIDVNSSIVKIKDNYIEGGLDYGIQIGDSSSVEIYNNEITNRYGPSIIIEESKASIINNLILSEAFATSAFHIFEGYDTKIANNILTGSGDDVIGIRMINSSDIEVNNNTFNVNGKGFVNENSDFSFYNNIVLGNSNSIGVHNVTSTSSGYNNIWGNAYNYLSCSPGEADISKDPLFVDIQNSDFRLGINSPCVDAGNPDQNFNDKDSTRNDMGAFGGPYAGTTWLTSTGSSLTIPSFEVPRNDTIIVPIIGQTIIGIADIELYISFDPEVFYVDKVNTAETTQNFSIERKEFGDNIVRILMNSPTGIQSDSGKIVNISFICKKTSIDTSIIRFADAILKNEISIEKHISKLVNGEMVIFTSAKEENEETIPSSYTLFQNYPNPFNPSTTIRYSIPSNVKSETANVKLVVFDVLGRVVATLVDKQQKPGNYEVQFNASNFTSGVYFYRLQSGSFVESRKMILLK